MRTARPPVALAAGARAMHRITLLVAVAGYDRAIIDVEVAGLTGEDLSRNPTNLHHPKAVCHPNLIRRSD